MDLFLLMLNETRTFEYQKLISKKPKKGGDKDVK